MALLPCEGCYDGYPDDWDYNTEEDTTEDTLADYADRLYDEVKCGDITEGQARNRFIRAHKKSTL